MSGGCGCPYGQYCDRCGVALHLWRTSDRAAHRAGCPQAPHAAELDRAMGDAPRAAVKGMYDGAACVGDVVLAEDYYHEGHPPMSPAAELDPVRRFLADVANEVENARKKFPNNGSVVQGLALGEESGEAQRALLHIMEGKSGEDPLWLECVQTAAMAVRLATESTDRTEWLGNVRKRTRDALQDISSSEHEHSAIMDEVTGHSDRQR